MILYFSNYINTDLQTSSRTVSNYVVSRLVNIYANIYIYLHIYISLQEVNATLELHWNEYNSFQHILIPETFQFLLCAPSISWYIYPSSLYFYKRASVHIIVNPKALKHISGNPYILVPTEKTTLLFFSAFENHRFPLHRHKVVYLPSTSQKSVNLALMQRPMQQ